MFTDVFLGISIRSRAIKMKKVISGLTVTTALFAGGSMAEAEPVRLTFIGDVVGVASAPDVEGFDLGQGQADPGTPQQAVIEVFYNSEPLTRNAVSEPLELVLRIGNFEYVYVDGDTQVGPEFAQGVSVVNSGDLEIFSVLGQQGNDELASNLLIEVAYETGTITDFSAEEVADTPFIPQETLVNLSFYDPADSGRIATSEVLINLTSIEVGSVEIGPPALPTGNDGAAVAPTPMAAGGLMLLLPLLMKRKQH